MERLHLVAVAARFPAWIETGCLDYLERLPREYALRRVQVRPEARTQGLTVERMLEQEAQRIRTALPTGARIVALDERGRDLTTGQLARELRRWLDAGTPTAFLIGGPDGLDPGLKQGADSLLRLSSLTLPHALAQLLFIEQLYRAASLLTGHPYHRA